MLSLCVGSMFAGFKPSVYPCLLTKLIMYLSSWSSNLCPKMSLQHIIIDFSIAFTQQLKQFAEMHNFLLIEDHKFADIGNTWKLQLEGGLLSGYIWLQFMVFLDKASWM